MERGKGECGNEHDNGLGSPRLRSVQSEPDERADPTNKAAIPRGIQERPAPELTHGRRENSDKSSEVLAEHDETITISIPDEIVQIIQTRISEDVWVGLLPRPGHYKEYPKEAQEKMLQWNDATILGEAKRLDKIVDADTRNSTLGIILSTLIAVLCLVLSFFLILFDKSVYGIVMLLPALGAFIAGIYNQNKRSKNEKTSKDNPNNSATG